MPYVSLDASSGVDTMTAAQLAFDMQPTAHLSPQQQAILDLLMEADGAWVSGVTLNSLGIFAYSQRIGELGRKGYPVESAGRGGVGRYRLVGQ